jgi:diamine oxidase
MKSDNLDDHVIYVNEDLLQSIPFAMPVRRRKRPGSYYAAMFFGITTFLLVFFIILMIFEFSVWKSVRPCFGGEVFEAEKILPTDHGVFTELNVDEIRSVEEYMTSQQHLKIVPSDSIKMDTTRISLIELWLPNKQETVTFLDKNGSKPERNARVVLIRGDVEIPVTEEYIVGSLPKPTFHRLLTTGDDRRKNPVMFHNRPADMAEYTALREIVQDVAVKADEILKESYSMSAISCDRKTIACARYDNAAPGTTKQGQRQTWFRFMRDEEGFYLYPTAFQVLVDFKSKDENEWKVIKVYYEGQFFETLDELLLGYNTNAVKKVKVPYKPDRTESTLRHRGQPRPSNAQMGPRQFYPQGKRFSVNGNSISYLGWEFQYSFFTSLGLQLYNIGFQGQRIAYEIGPHEVAVLYSGITPLSYTTNFFDSQYLLGAFSFEMVPGVDCPEHASYMDAIVYKNGHPVKLRNAICIFEHNTGMPLRRHYEMDAFNYARPSSPHGKDSNPDASYLFFGGAVDNVLIVRTIAAIFNYDYIFDYIFHNNGVMETKVTPTGYIHAAPKIDDPAQKEYGFNVFGNAIGSIHNHLVAYKVDLDVLGENNRFETLDIVPDKIKLEWTETPMELHQRKFERNLRLTEKDAALKYNFEAPKYYLMYNKNETNPYGHERAYKLTVNGMSKMLLPENEGIEAGLSWARYQLAVTRRKDNERSSSSIYNGIDPYEAVSNFQEYIDDDESIVDKVS